MTARNTSAFETAMYVSCFCSSATHRLSPCSHKYPSKKKNYRIRTHTWKILPFAHARRRRHAALVLNCWVAVHLLPRNILHARRRQWNCPSRSPKILTGKRWYRWQGSPRIVNIPAIGERTCGNASQSFLGVSTPKPPHCHCCCTNTFTVPCLFLFLFS